MNDIAAALALLAKLRDENITFNISSGWGINGDYQVRLQNGLRTVVEEYDDNLATAICKAARKPTMIARSQNWKLRTKGCAH